MILKPQDVVILFKLIAIKKADWSFSTLSVDLFMSPSEVHAGIRRAMAANLAVKIINRVTPAVAAWRSLLFTVFAMSMFLIEVKLHVACRRSMPVPHCPRYWCRLMILPQYGRILKEMYGGNHSHLCTNQYLRLLGRTVNYTNF